MGLDWYEQVPVARAVFDQADELLGFSLSAICFDGPEEVLTDTVNQQPALFVTSIAAWQAMLVGDWPAPAFVAGHSVGEFSALVAAGSLDFADGLSLVRRRGELMKAAGEREPGAMAAILALDIATIREICRQASERSSRPVQVANDNCPGQVVISGAEPALAEAITLAQAAGARKVVRLPITIAAHSSLMAPAATDFSQAVDEVVICPPQVTIIGNGSGKPLLTPEAIRSELKTQLTSAVAWTESMNYLCRQGVDTVVEVGPGHVLQDLMKRIDRQVRRLSFAL
jgi:[acyl-carrier-protein] S-malonyltransferase